MTITREINGETVNITLTQFEMYAAYCEQQNNCDIEDMTSFMETYMDWHGDNPDCLTEEEYEKRIQEFARLYREALDDGSAYDWWDVADGAIKQALENEKLHQNTRAEVDESPARNYTKTKTEGAQNMTNYFCDACGWRFESEIPELNEDGLHNDIPCPHCGAHCVYPDTAENAAASVREQTAYENKQIEWED